MNALLLGGSGFIGKNLTEGLLNKGIGVTIFDRNCSKNDNRDIEYVIGEYKDINRYGDMFKNKDIVIHLISTTIPSNSNTDPYFDIDTNLKGSIDIISLCLEKCVDRLIYFSSGGAIYGHPKYLPIDEDHETNPKSSYGIIKLAIEKYLLLYNELYGLKYTILRPSNPYGPGQNPYGQQGVIMNFLGKILRNESIEIWGNGAVVRDYIYIDDLVEAIIGIMTSENESKSDIYNIGTGIGYSLNEIVEIIRKTIKKEIQIKYFSGRKIDEEKVILNSDKIARQILWRPQTNIAEGIDKSWEYIKNKYEEA